MAVDRDHSKTVLNSTAIHVSKLLMTPTMIWKFFQGGLIVISSRCIFFLFSFSGEVASKLNYIVSRVGGIGLAAAGLSFIIQVAKNMYYARKSKRGAED